MNGHNGFVIPEEENDDVPQGMCDIKTDKGGWIIIQQRVDGSVNFNRPWADYKNGFGDISGNFWLGLDRMHCLTKDGTYTLRFDMWDGNDKRYAKYFNFTVGDETSFYKNDFNGFEGDLIDCFRTHRRMKFTTLDLDNDYDTNINCANSRNSGFWFWKCGTVNPNGLYGGDRSGGIHWVLFTGRDKSLTKIQMKIKKFG